MDSLPGSPQIQNVIPTTFLGTSVYAGPILGIFISIVMFSSGMMWLTYRVNKAKRLNQGYGDHTLNEPEKKETKLPPWQISILPLLIVLVVNFVGNKVVNWNPDILLPIANMKLPLMAPGIKNVISTWSLIIAIVCGITTAVAFGYRGMIKGSLSKAINLGAVGSLLAIMNVASEVGYGNVIAALPGFKTIATSVQGMTSGHNPLMSMAITTNIICGITGSASGGVSIALDLFGKTWLSMASSIGMSPDVLHRMAAIASGGLDTGPHNGAIITLLAVCGLTHRQSYPDIFAMTVLKTLMVVISLGFIAIFHIA
jgi:H+/gluconate symporter-like permease